ncbi:FAD-binding protein [Paenibacillus timonensis]|uniref:UDP-N-acetylenolpyruvoylglucosamine reductase n=1 Tax=Paenibacillus timonensis TaxID=225915 RepID=A0ABW3SCG6_9BACL|nr:FAD-binding protein [Paenibacillus timonensis]MCH1640041.1 FAD-binding protein [Paenibacillus timonensis]
MTSWNLGGLRTEQALSRFSTYEIGGEARFVGTPQSQDQLQELLEMAYRRGITPIFFGGGSNMLFPDRPDPDALFLTTREMVDVKLEGDRLYVSAGMPMSMLAVIGHGLGIADFDFTFLLPGTVGGGIYMNAKYFDRHISDTLIHVHYIDLHQPGGIQTVTREACEFGYKQSVFQRNRSNWLIVGAEFKLSSSEGAVALPMLPELADFQEGKLPPIRLPEFASYFIGWLDNKNGTGARDSALAPMRRIVQDRVGKMHFTYPSCGSVFKNNYSVGEPIGKLADHLNLRGVQRGNARISPVHGNVIQNVGGATAADVIELIHHVQEAFDRHYGFVPEPEVVIIEGKASSLRR